ncbi:MAG TPA: phage protein Gp13 family protein [Thermoguttaceae bacterium]|nr:phage protein Gp13 family protein [Thermoguttaceae bacterium]
MHIPFDLEFVRPSTVDDAARLAATIRSADRDEIRANSGKLPIDALVAGIQWSDPCLSVVYHNDVLAMFGVVPTGTEKVGAVWMLASNLLEPNRLPRRAAIRFLRRSIPWVDWLNEQWPLLWNVVDARNTLHIQWLEWSGFKLLRTVEQYGFERRPFIEFSRSHHV